MAVEYSHLTLQRLWIAKIVSWFNLPAQARVCAFPPSLLLQKTALVISPTIRLMTDEVKKLCDRGIEATFLGTVQADKDVDKKIMKEIMF